jgi:amino acid adenylation domain-containing protein
MPRTLASLLADSAARFPGRVAVVDPTAGESATYAELKTRAAEIADGLRARGIGAGDRVGICAPKSIATVAAIFGILEAGAAYVPVDAAAPPSRNGFIFSDCAVAAVLAAENVAPSLARALDFPESNVTLGGLTVLDGGRAGKFPAPDLAYILYTSGSTGNPKGVMLTHANGLSFVDWCSEAFSPEEHDRFSSHAPFHFDLSILDLYVPIKHGAALVLIGEALGKNARQLAPAIASERISVWYSTPTVLRLLTEFGDLPNLDLSALRLILFAGEVFPLKHLRALKSLLPAPKYWNLYGPTETNVCTALEIPDAIPESRDTPFPIGPPCSNVTARVVDPATGEELPNGEEGELVIHGGPVTSGYWNLPDRSATAFLTLDGMQFYRTGDIVKDVGSGVLDYIGRRDRMVKRRGFRVELGEIEAGLYKHPQVVEAAVIAVSDAESGVNVIAFLSCDGGEQSPKTVQMKMFSAKNLLAYMVPDRFIFLETMPKTSTDKVDYQRLIALATGETLTKP